MVWYRRVGTRMECPTPRRASVVGVVVTAGDGVFGQRLYAGDQDDIVRVLNDGRRLAPELDHDSSHVGTKARITSPYPTDRTAPR